MSIIADPAVSVNIFTEEFINSVFVSSGDVAREGRQSIRYFRENESIKDCVQGLIRQILILS